MGMGQCPCFCRDEGTRSSAAVTPHSSFYPAAGDAAFARAIEADAFLAFSPDASAALFTWPALGVGSKEGLAFPPRDFLLGDPWLPLLLGPAAVLWGGQEEEGAGGRPAVLAAAGAGREGEGQRGLHGGIS